MRTVQQNAEEKVPAARGTRIRLVVALFLLSCGIATAQGPGRAGGPGGGPGSGGHIGMPGERGPGGHPPPGGGRGNMPAGGSRNPLQPGPGGRWWDEGKYARTVGLTSDQQRRMDSAFQESRGSLVSGLDNLRKAQARLDTVSKSDHPSESALVTEIQNVAQARADLEKANTHMLLQIRNEMTAEQLNKLEQLK